jgi:hypothetical protein
MIKYLLFWCGFIILLVVEIARVYFIMPFPGSQESDTINLAYFIESNLWLIRIIGCLIFIYPFYAVVKGGSKIYKRVTIGLIIIYCVTVYLFNVKFLADKMFLQPSQIVMASKSHNKVDSAKLIIGVVWKGKSKAYPIEVIGYHHQVRDSIGNEPIMVTYCTVCRTGRVFSPIVHGKLENFRLVGMDHFNAMFEDATTKSWWRQVNGEALVGPLKGTTLAEIPSEQMSLAAWLARYPETEILQPDSAFKDEYEKLKDYDEGKSKSKLTKPDTLSWKDKSWVVGVSNGLFATAYDWVQLKKARVVNDEIAGQPVVIVIENDLVSFHAFKRTVGQHTLVFKLSADSRVLEDSSGLSKWDWSGKCLEGPWKDTHLQPLQAYQEFWHSWRTFHPQTKMYKQ